MSSIFSRVSLYDMLSMLIPGYLVVYLIIRSFFHFDCWGCDGVTSIVIIFCVSYVIGMLIHYTSRWMFGWLNNKWFAEHALRQFYTWLETLNVDHSTVADKHLYKEWRYQAFFRLWGKNGLAHIPAMEAQLSFLRSLSLVGLLYLIFGCRFIDSSFILSMIGVMTITSILLMSYIRYRIYYYYFEANYFINDENNK